MTVPNPWALAPEKLTQAERSAWVDGWKVSDGDGARTDRPNYLTHAEREAFNRGWDYRDEPRKIARAWAESQRLLDDEEPENSK